MFDVVAENEIKDENLKKEINATGQIFYTRVVRKPICSFPMPACYAIPDQKSIRFGKAFRKNAKITFSLRTLFVPPCCRPL
jgi:hypothetical protein